jgi:hypothetical protein
MREISYNQPRRPFKAEVPGIEAAKQAKQAEAAAQREAITQVVTAVKRSITSWFSAWSGHGDGTDDAKAPKMSGGETRQMAGAVNKLPTSFAGVSTETGPAPTSQ